MRMYATVGFTALHAVIGNIDFFADRHKLTLHLDLVFFLDLPLMLSVSFDAFHKICSFEFQIFEIRRSHRIRINETRRQENLLCRKFRTAVLRSGGFHYVEIVLTLLVLHVHE